MECAAGNPKMSRRQQSSRDTDKLMKRVMRGIYGQMDEVLSASGITAAQVRLLAEVRERPGSTGAQLARALVVARALKSGWLRRGVHEENSRLVTLRLTPAGTRLLAEADLVARKLEAELWAGVSLAEMGQVRAILERCLANLAR